VLVSLIIATKNRPEHLAKALYYLKQQRYQAWEAVITDDGDGRGLQLANQDEDTRIKAFENVGLAQVDARNTSVSFAKGELLALHDDDDWWEDAHHLEKVVKAFQTPSDAIKDALLYRYGWIVVEQDDSEPSRTVFDIETTPTSLLKNNSILTSSIVYPRQLHQKLGLFDRAVDGYFDWDWLLRVVKAGYPLLCIDTPGVCYLQHGNNGSQSVTSERRLRNFNALKTKHALDIVIKNHSSLLSEMQH